MVVDSFPPDEQGELEALLVEFASTRSMKSGLETYLDGMTRRLKAWLDAHPGEELVDGEHGLRAYLQPRRGQRPYDLLSLRLADPVLFERLLDLGCLTVNPAAVKAQGAQVGGINRFAGPEPVSYSLQVKEG